MGVPLSVWSTYGFSTTPYSTTSLQLENADARLLVGRERELRLILSDLVSGASLIALEGDYGVGKSSLAAVAAYEACKWEVKQGDPFYLAAPKPLELIDSDTADSFEKRAYFQIAAAILAREKELRFDGNVLAGIDSFITWLKSPGGTGWSAGIGISIALLGGFNVSAGRSGTFNTTQGFSDEGVISLIDGWLDELFVDATRGGVICRLDNLESLAKSRHLIDVFESLRDRLFKRKGLRWILSGAEGMVRAGLSTPKMSGAFSEPIDLGPLLETEIPEVIRRRDEVFRTRTNSTLPVEPETFESVYTQTGKNLRFTLGLADKYAMRSRPEEVIWMKPEQKERAFLDYVEAEGRRVVEQLAKNVSSAGWRVLGQLVVDKSGFCSPSEYKDFGYSNMPPLLAQIKNLQELGLIDYQVDDEDGRRRRVTATNDGRLAVALRSAQTNTP